MIKIRERGVTMSERFSVVTSIHEKKMRIISGITGLSLLQEDKHDEASEYIKSFVKLKDYSLKYLALLRALPPEQTDLEIGTRLLEIAKTISAGNLSKKDMREYASELAGILHEARRVRR